MGFSDIVNQKLSTHSFKVVAIRRRPMRAAWRAYCALLERRPLPTKMATTGTMFFLSANIHNSFNEPPEGTALRRVVGTAAIGGFLHAPIIHWWFGLLEKTFPGAHPARVVTKVFLDQTIGLVRALATPMFMCAIFPSVSPSLHPQKAHITNSTTYSLIVA